MNIYYAHVSALLATLLHYLYFQKRLIQLNIRASIPSYVRKRKSSQQNILLFLQDKVVI